MADSKRTYTLVLEGDEIQRLMAPIYCEVFSSETDGSVDDRLVTKIAHAHATYLRDYAQDQIFETNKIRIEWLSNELLRALRDRGQPPREDEIGVNRDALEIILKTYDQYENGGGYAVSDEPQAGLDREWAFNELYEALTKEEGGSS